MKGVVQDLREVGLLLGKARKLAIKYREITDRPLGITGEVAEYEAARLLGLKLAKVRQAGYDVVRSKRGKKEEWLQVKGRCVLNGKTSGRLGAIDVKKEWHAVLLVLLDAKLEPTEIYEAERSVIVAALKRPGSKSRNVRGALSISKFKSIAEKIWSAR